MSRHAGLHLKKVDLALRPVNGLVLQGDIKKFYEALGFESLDPFLTVSKQGPRFTAIEGDRSDKTLVQLACETDGVASPDPI